MSKNYFMLYYDFIEETEALSDEERGRLVTAILEYARSGAVLESMLTGHERFLFPHFRSQVDRDARAYEARVARNAANGKKGGRPKKARKDVQNPVGFPETEKRQYKDKDKDKDEDKDKDKDEYEDKDKVCEGARASAPHAPAPDDDDLRLQKPRLRVPHTPAPDENDLRLQHAQPRVPHAPAPDENDLCLQHAQPYISHAPVSDENDLRLQHSQPYIPHAPVSDENDLRLQHSQPRVPHAPVSDENDLRLQHSQPRVPHSPALDDVLEFCKANALRTDPHTFWNYYQAIGWKVSGHPIRDWQAKLREWEAREAAGGPRFNAPRPSLPAPVNPALSYAQRDYPDDDRYFIDLDAYASPEEGSG